MLGFEWTADPQRQRVRTAALLQSSDTKNSHDRKPLQQSWLGHGPLDVVQLQLFDPPSSVAIDGPRCAKSRRPLQTVAINEAVELAKRYGAKQSPQFVNGILDRFLQERRAQQNA